MKPPAFQFYADDFIAGTCDMSAADVGAYIRLLCYQWSRGEIPTDREKLNRITGADVSADVLAKFPEGKNERMESERQKQADYRKLQADKANARWHKPGNAGAYATASIRHMPKACSPSPSPSPSNIKTLGASAPRTARPAVKQDLPDDAWLASLRSNPAYDGINIGLEFGKMQAWCGANRKTPSRRRFINWLNRAERPMARQTTIPANSSHSGEPVGWRDTLKRILPQSEYDGSWATLADSLKTQIRNLTTP